MNIKPSGKSRLLVLLVLVSCFLSSCSSFSFSTDYAYPPGKKLYKVAVEATGTQRFVGGFIGGESWVGHVVLYKSDVPNGDYRYPFEAANLNFDAVWTGLGECVVHFYNYPDGLNEGDKDEKKLRKLIVAKHYHYDEKADHFIEVP